MIKVNENDKITVRKANINDIERIAFIEEKCFTKEEAASIKQFVERFNVYGNHFLCLDYEGTTVGFINGMVTNDDTISDEIYEKTTSHNEEGLWQTVFGLDVLEEYRHQGLATILMNQFINEAKKEGRKGVILTCKERLISFYGGFGYKNQGISESVHGGVVWYDMKLEF